MSSEQTPGHGGTGWTPVPTYLATLELDRNASRTTQQAAILQRIGDSLFVPSPVHDLAMGRWQGLDAIHDVRERPSRATNIVTNGYTAAILVEFARRFFELSPHDRTQKWTHLSQECANDRILNDFLQRLKPHLDIVVPDTTTWPADAAALLQGLLTILVADPMDGALLRRALTINALAHPHEYTNALKHVRSHAKSIVARHRDLLRDIAQGQRARHRQPRPWSQVVYPAPADASWFKQLTTADFRPVHLPRVASATNQYSSLWTWFWVALVVIGGLLGKFDESRKKTMPPTPRPATLPGPTPIMITYATNTQHLFSRADDVPQLIDELLVSHDSEENILDAMDDLARFATSIRERDLEVGVAWHGNTAELYPTVGECYGLAIAIGAHAVGRTLDDKEIGRRIRELSEAALADIALYGIAGWEASIKRIDQSAMRLRDDPFAPPSFTDEQQTAWQRLAKEVMVE